MATKLRQVILHGEYRSQPATVTFSRDGDRWYVLLQICGDSKTISHPSRDVKPCWTIAVRLLEQWFPMPGKHPAAKQKQPKRKPALKVFGEAISE